MESNPDRKPNDIGSRLRQLRSERDLTPTQFAVKVGQSASHIYNVETGRRPLQPHMIPAYAAALGMTEAEFRSAVGPDDDDEEPELAAAS